ncbi:MAG: ShlB/FhaC/HecB family hemolysin secretion/activation protein [Rhodospirillaceae bacterium]
MHMRAISLNRNFEIAAAGVVIGLAVAFNATVAAAQQLPSSLDPSRLEQRFEQPAVPQSKPAIKLPAPEQAPPPEKAGAIRFTLASLIIDGGTIFPSEEIVAFYHALLGQEISLLDLYKLRDAISVKYRNAGYVLSQAVIPAQEIDGGIVHMAIVEGHLNKVIFQGEVTDRFGILEDYAQKLTASRPLLASVLERYVMLMDDLPGLTARTVIKPAEGDAVGSNLEVVLERKPIGATLSLDNRGTKSVGPYQIDHGFTFNDILGQFEQTSIRGILTPQIDELRYVDLSHTEQLGLDGATIEVGARRNWSEPGFNIRPLSIKSQSSTLRGGVAYPLIRSRSETLRLTFDGTYRNSRTNAQGQKLSDDRIRYLSAGVSYDIADSWQGSNLFQFSLNRGFDLFNATDGDKPGQSRVGARPNYTKLTFSAQRLQPLPERFSVLVATEGQFSPNLLVSGEQFGVGGKLYGRAFDSSEITGDKGASAKIELQYTPEIELPYIQYLQLFSYTDYGRAWNYASGGLPSGQSLATVGFGVRYGITESLNGGIEFGKPFMRNATATGNRDPRVFFSLSARY